MKLIGTIENNFNVYFKDKKVIVKFENEPISISVENFEYYPNLSEETNCFTGTLIVNGKNVGSCRNDGRGGCASCYFNNGIRNAIEEHLSTIENYCFPKNKLNIYDVVDEIANFIIIFQENKVKTIKKTKLVIDELIKSSNQYREYYLNHFK